MRPALVLMLLVAGCRTMEYPEGAVAAPVEVATVSWGTHHACSMSSRGGPVCWGSNAAGQLGSSTIESSAVPVAPELGPLQIDTVVAGEALTCGLDPERRAWCWGGGDAFPRLVASGTRFQELKGAALFCGRAEAGTIWCWESATDLAKPIPGTDGLTKWDVGSQGCGLLADSTAACWTFPTALAPVPGGLKFRTISAGYGHACGIGADLLARCWGIDNGGALGNGTRGSSTSPVMVDAVPGSYLVQVHAGDAFSCGVALNQRAFCWGSAAEGKVGVGYFNGVGTLFYQSPVGVAPSRNFVGELVIARRTTCGHADDGLLYCWGSNEHFQFGSGPEPYEWSPWPALSVTPFAAPEAP